MNSCVTILVLQYYHLVREVVVLISLFLMCMHLVRLSVCLCPFLWVPRAGLKYMTEAFPIVTYVENDPFCCEYVHVCIIVCS